MESLKCFMQMMSSHLKVCTVSFDYHQPPPPPRVNCVIYTVSQLVYTVSNNQQWYIPGGITQALQCTSEFYPMFIRRKDTQCAYM